MSSRLGIYNGALRHLAERRLVDLTEERSARRELDDAYAGTVKLCLQKGFWNFAMRSVKTFEANDLEASFGYVSIHVKPADWIRTLVISENERFDPPLLRYQDEGRYWHCDAAELYIRYVSQASDYGANEGLWPESFAQYVEVALAFRVAPVIKAGAADDLYKLQRRYLANARALDAMDEPPGFAPMGTWASSRASTWVNRSRWNGRFQ